MFCIQTLVQFPLVVQNEKSSYEVSGSKLVILFISFDVSGTGGKCCDDSSNGSGFHENLSP